MRLLKLYPIALVFSLSAVLATACSNDDNDDHNDPGTQKGCYIELFDGDNFKDDHIKIEGEGEYADLSNLPGSNGKDWTDEADSFKVGSDASVTVWVHTNFEGDSTVYSGGDYPSVNEPQSLKIICGENQ